MYIYIYVRICTLKKMYMKINMYVHQLPKNEPCIPLAISLRPTSVDDVVGYLQVLAADWLWAPCGQHNQGEFKPRPLTEMFQASTKTNIYIYIIYHLLYISIYNLYKHDKYIKRYTVHKYSSIKVNHKHFRTIQAD